MADDQVIERLEKIAEKLGTEPDAIDEMLGIVLIKMLDLEARLSEIEATLREETR